MSFNEVILLVLPALMILVGIILLVLAKRNTNGWIGFRTQLSMQSKENWEYSNKYLGLSLLSAGIIHGLVALVLIITGRAKSINDPILVVIIGIQLVTMITLSFITKNMLERRNNKGE